MVLKTTVAILALANVATKLIKIFFQFEKVTAGALETINALPPSRKKISFEKCTPRYCCDAPTPQPPAPLPRLLIFDKNEKRT